MERKGICVGIADVVDIVMMVVIALSVTYVVAKLLSGFSGNSKAIVGTSSLCIRCQAELATRCGSNASFSICAACRSCPVGVVCL